MTDILEKINYVSPLYKRYLMINNNYYKNKKFLSTSKK